ncbi:MAG TPA: DUF934 domain-containing protein [Rhizomicrobium sp.]|jgi:uncharacterized protein (DUF934 family)|nr:DUF934 domain-containing protein [Rhizomicrobium sp.]
MPLIRNSAFADDTYVTVADDAPLPANGAIVSRVRFTAERETLLARNAALGVRLKSAESPEPLGEDVHRLSVIVLEFPVFRDGRAFSWARMLRTRMGFAGEIRATGHFLYDQLAFMTRTGFDSFEVPEGFTLDHFHRALTEITDVYQPSADRRKTIRQLRAGA